MIDACLLAFFLFIHPYVDVCYSYFVSLFVVCFFDVMMGIYVTASLALEDLREAEQLVPERDRAGVARERQAVQVGWAELSFGSVLHALTHTHTHTHLHII